MSMESMQRVDVSLIPHRSPMHWLDEAVVDSAGCTFAKRLIHADHPFVLQGKLLRTALIEMMSQAAAAGSAHHAGTRGKNIRRGFLVAIRDLQFSGDASIGQTVTLSALPERTAGNLTLCRTTAAVENNVIASARMTFHLEFI